MINVKKTSPQHYRTWMWYRRHQDELVEQYNGKYLLISGKKVCGAYDDKMDAYYEGCKNYAGKFIVQRCSPGDADLVVKISNPLVLWQLEKQ